MKKLLVAFVLILSFSFVGCDYLAPGAEKSKTEKKQLVEEIKQTELEVKQLEALQEQNKILRERNDILRELGR